MNEKTLKIFLDRVQEDGAATLGVKDGRFVAFSRDKLQEILKSMKDGQEHCMIFIKTVN